LRCSRRSKGKNVFEYLVDELSTWITEDQLRISLSPMLFAELKASSPNPLGRAQSQTHPKQPVTPINDKLGHTPFAPPGPALSDDPDEGKRGEKRRHQDMYTEIRSETHHSVNTDDNTTPAILAMRSKVTKATRSPRLSIDVGRLPSIIATNMPGKLLGTRMRQKRRRKL